MMDAGDALGGRCSTAHHITPLHTAAGHHATFLGHLPQLFRRLGIISHSYSVFGNKFPPIVERPATFWKKDCFQELFSSIPTHFEKKIVSEIVFIDCQNFEMNLP